MFYQIIVAVAIFTVAVHSDSQGRVHRIGNLMKASRSGIDVTGATFIINDIVLQEGVVFAYRAFYRSDSPMRFQIWRPTDNSTLAADSTSISKEFTLVSETRVVPSVVDAVEDVYIASKLVEKCARVMKGDRLGVHFETSPGAVAYVFDSSDPRAYGRTLNTSDPIYSTIPTTFDSIAFPFDFSVAAYVDTELSRYDSFNDSIQVDCPAGLLIPTIEDVTAAPTTPPPPPTGRPGDTGATGPMGMAGDNGKDGLDGTTGPQGLMGATGEAGRNGTDGVDGVNGANGTDGQPGAVGATGLQGERGLQGPAGPAGETVTVVADTNGGAVAAQSTSSFMSSDMATLLIFAWLALTTLLIIFLIVTVCVLCRRRKQQNQDKYIYDDVKLARDNTDGGISKNRQQSLYINNIGAMERANSVNDANGMNSSWMGTMNSTAETIYSTATITTNNRDSTPNISIDQVREKGSQECLY